MRKYLLIASIFLLFRALAAVTPVQADSPAQPRLQVSAWMPTAWDGSSAHTSFTAHSDYLSAISPFWYGVQASGALTPWAGSRDASLVREARASGVRVIPTISNQYQGQPIHDILNTPDLARAHRQTIVQEVLRYDYDGIDIDYENLAAADKILFTAWAAALANDLHAHNKSLTITVQPKTFAATGWDGPGAQDYGALAAAADSLRIMTYGWCWATGCVGSTPPGPIAPIHWMRRVIRYAKSQAPAQKLVLGVHLYGYDWPEASTSQHRELLCRANSGRALVWTQAESLRQTHAAPLHWWEDDDSGLIREPWFTFDDGDQHHVTFANADSVAARLQLAQEEELQGIIFWRLGGEDPDLWQRIPRQHFGTWLPMVEKP